MNIHRRWEYCVYQRGNNVHTFINEYFTAHDRQVLFIGGVGFDQRTTAVSTALVSLLQQRIHGLILREERPNADKHLVERTLVYLKQMQQMLSNCIFQSIDIFAPDGAVIGGRNVVLALQKITLDNITDILIDASVLSIGVLFPLVRYILQRVKTNTHTLHVHVMITGASIYDNAITATASDIVGTIHGFKGGLDLDQNYDAARLWLPQLARGQRAVLERLHIYINPHDICPILPFPAHHPRFADSLIEYYQQEFESTWAVDDSAIVYATEHNPLDLYRTILQMDEARKRIFASRGNSLIVLSPIGSKALALGALMAAIERDLPVVYVETISYTVEWALLDQKSIDQQDIMHIWLYDGEQETSLDTKV